MHRNSARQTVQVPAAVRAGDALTLFFTGNRSEVTVAARTGGPCGRRWSPTAIVGRLWTRTATAADAGSTISVASTGMVKSDLTVVAYRGASGLGASAVAVDTTTGAAHTTPSVVVSEPASTLVSYWADKSTASSGWSVPVSQRVRTGSTGDGGGHITAVLSDAGPLPPGTRGGVTATADATASRAVMFSLVLEVGT